MKKRNVLLLSIGFLVKVSCTPELAIGGGPSYDAQKGRIRLPLRVVPVDKGVEASGKPNSK